MCQPNPKAPPESDSTTGGSGPDALERALEAFRPYLLRVANEELDSGLKPKEGASDVVQQAFLTAYIDREKCRDRSPTELKLWLRAILMNNVSRVVRRYKSTNKRKLEMEVPLSIRGSEGSIDDVLVHAEPSPCDQVIQDEQRALLVQAIGRLKEPAQKVVIWRHRDNCSWAEIAERLDTTADAAQKMYSRAVERLRAELGDPPVQAS